MSINLQTHEEYIEELGDEEDPYDTAPGDVIGSAGEFAIIQRVSSAEKDCYFHIYHLDYHLGWAPALSRALDMIP